MKRITYSKRASKYINKQNYKIKLAIKNAIENIPKGDIKYFKSDNVWRLRIGNLRILYYRDGDNIHVDDIGSRGDIYK